MGQGWPALHQESRLVQIIETNSYDSYLCWDVERSKGLNLVMLLQLAAKLFYLTGQNCNPKVTGRCHKTFHSPRKDSPLPNITTIL